MEVELEALSHKMGKGADMQLSGRVLGMSKALGSNPAWPQGEEELLGQVGYSKGGDLHTCVNISV